MSLPSTFRPMTIASGIRAAAGRGPSRIALRMGTATRDYATLLRRIDQATDATLALSLPHGAHAAIIAPNSMSYIEIVCGVPEAGIPVATLDCKLTRPEMVAALHDSQARLLFADPATAALLQGAHLPLLRRIVILGTDYEAWLASATPQPRPAVAEWDTWTIPYTSGTTGQPKGVLLPHRARIMVGFLSHTEFGCFGADDVFLTTTPMNHGAGLGFPMAALQGGGTLEIAQGFDAEAVLRRFKHGGITGTFMVPTHFHKIFALDASVLEECKQPGLRAIIANAAPLSAAMKQRIVPYFGDGVLHEIYGATESGLVSSLKPRHQLTHEACVGLPFAHTLVKILDEDGKDCPPGTIGDVFSTSPCMFNGYWNRTEETEAALRNGWLSVGDMGRFDEDGFLYLAGRRGDLVISGGVNIHPREIEDVLAVHPAIAEAAVIGVPDEKWGERVCAFVALRQNAALAHPELEAFCRERLAAYKVPRETRFLPALPRTANGKVLTRALRAL